MSSVDERTEWYSDKNSWSVNSWPSPLHMRLAKSSDESTFSHFMGNSVTIDWMADRAGAHQHLRVERKPPAAMVVRSLVQRLPPQWVQRSAEFELARRFVAPPHPPASSAFVCRLPAWFDRRRIGMSRCPQLARAACNLDIPKPAANHISGVRKDPSWDISIASSCSEGAYGSNSTFQYASLMNFVQLATGAWRVA